MWFWFPFIGAITSVIKAFAEGLGPMLKGISEAFVELIKVLYEGCIDILDNWKTVVTVAVISSSITAYMTYVIFPKKYDTSCAKVIKELRKDYKFIPRKKNETYRTWSLW